MRIEEKIQERIPPHKIGLAKLLDEQIKVLEQNGDRESVFDKNELRQLEILGYAEYLADLKRMRHNIGQPEDLGGDQ